MSGGSGTPVPQQPAPQGGLLGNATQAAASRDKYLAYRQDAMEQGVRPLPYDQWAKQQPGLIK